MLVLTEVVLVVVELVEMVGKEKIILQVVQVQQVDNQFLQI